MKELGNKDLKFVITYMKRLIKMSTPKSTRDDETIRLAKNLIKKLRKLDE